MKNFSIVTLFLWAMMSCTNSGSKSTIEKSEAELQLLEKIPNPDFKEFVGTFVFGEFPWDVSETPFFSNEELPANFRKISLEDFKKFINPHATDTSGYYTGYAFFENEYIAIIFFNLIEQISGVRVALLSIYLSYVLDGF